MDMPLSNIVDCGIYHIEQQYQRTKDHFIKKLNKAHDGKSPLLYNLAIFYYLLAAMSQYQKSQFCPVGSNLNP